MELEKYKREFCCSNCGLVWFGETTVANSVTCPECENDGKEGRGIYACDSNAFIYGYFNILRKLTNEGKNVHYAKDHPNYGKE